jgi:hypothetical protein
MNVAFCRLRGVLNRLFSCNTAPAATVPGLCPGLSLVVAIAGLAAMMLAPRPAALAAGHDLRGAGNANWGQLGIGVTYQTASRIGGADTTVISLSAGASHTVYVDSDGKLWATGYNGKGQLGDGSTTDRETPLQIATDVAQASAGWNHTLFIKTDGSLWGMGDNTYGQLGSASSGVRTTPVLIATDVAKAAAGEYQSIFIKTDGTAWLMDSQINPVHRVPFQVASDVVAISAGSRHVVYIKGDHSL